MTTNDRPSLRHLRAFGAALTAATALAITACVPDPGSPPTSTSSTSTTTSTLAPTPNQEAAQEAASWLLTQFGAGGFMDSTWTPGTYDAGNAVLAITDLAALHVGDASLPTRLSVFKANMESYIDQGGDRAGALARVIMLAVAVGENPRDFGGTDLVARLEATQQPSGLYGAQYAGFDGAFRQGLALSALSLVTPAPASITPGPGQTIEDLPAVAWLLDQQCDDGSWLMFRANTADPCVENPGMGVYKDSNGSALAVLGLSAVGATADVDPGLWFTAVRGDDGGWASSPSGPTQESDADSTGLVVAALESLGSPPDASAYDALRDFQLGDSFPAGDRGAFTWKLSTPSADRLATLDALTGLFDEVWPSALQP